MDPIRTRRLATELYDFVELLGSKEVSRFRQYGTGHRQFAYPEKGISRA
jgi:hypothetical protein